MTPAPNRIKSADAVFHFLEYSSTVFVIRKFHSRPEEAILFFLFSHFIFTKNVYYVFYFSLCLSEFMSSFFLSIAFFIFLLMKSIFNLIN